MGSEMCIRDSGPSGSGKSTLLRTINHLERVDEGFIQIDGDYIGYRRKGDKLYEMKEKEILRQRINVGYVFQNFNLFPHRTVLENIIEGPVIVKGEDKQESMARARELLAKVGLSGKENSYPRRLSGGQQQRVAIARALAMRPDVILFDEPTSALDIAHQVDVLALVHRLSQQRGLTVIAVLHDINMAARYCDYLVALRGGEMIAQGTPAELMRSDTLEQIYGIPMGILPHPAGAAPGSFVY